MSSPRSYLTRPAYAAAKAEKLRREAEDRRRWWDGLMPPQLTRLEAAGSWDEFWELLRRWNYPGAPDESENVATVEAWLFQEVSTERYPMIKLPTAILDEIAYGRDPEMRARRRAWHDNLSDVQRQALDNAGSEEELKLLLRKWDYPEQEDEVGWPVLAKST